jgi:pimeloyl-ACP methyl ester carboxylesterase
MISRMERLDRIVLVHGAGHGAWCWEELVPLLEGRGYQVSTLDLPGLGDDSTPSASVTLEGYFQRVIEVVNAGIAPVLLVGHSMGGVPISGAAEALPDKVGRLVYLAALLPENGLRISEFDLGEDSAQRAVVPRDEGTIDFDPRLVQDIFYNTCPPEFALRAAGRLRPQATGAFTTRILLTAERWGRVPKTYIICTRDRAFPPAKQYWLCNRLPDIRRRLLHTDHSPFYSDPEGLADLLDIEARGTRDAR